MSSMTEEIVRNKILDMMKLYESIHQEKLPDDIKQNIVNHIMFIIDTTGLGTPEQDHIKLISFMAGMIYGVYVLNMKLEGSE